MDRTVANNKKSNSFNIWRVVFTLIIMLFHLTDQYSGFYSDYPFLYYHWYVVVEFFFILSGFLMASHAEKNPAESAFSYTGGRIKRLYPEYILVFVVSIIQMWIQYDMSPTTLVADNFEEVFMLQSIGTGKFPYINNPAWYVSSMFIAGHFIYYLLQRHKALFLEFIGPIVLVGLIGYFYKYLDALASFFGTSSFGVSTGVLRAIIGLTIGIYIYYLSEWYTKKKEHNNQVLMAVVEVCAFLFVIVFSITHESQLYDFVFLFVSAIGVFCASRNCMWDKFVNSAVIRFLSRISYMLFLSHFIVLKLFWQIWADQQWRWWLVPVYIIATIVLSVVLCKIKELLVKLVVCLKKNKV